MAAAVQVQNRNLPELIQERTGVRLEDVKAFIAEYVSPKYPRAKDAIAFLSSRQTVVDSQAAWNTGFAENVKDGMPHKFQEMKGRLPSAYPQFLATLNQDLIIVAQDKAVSESEQSFDRPKFIATPNFYQTHNSHVARLESELGRNNSPLRESIIRAVSSKVEKLNTLSPDDQKLLKLAAGARYVLETGIGKSQAGERESLSTAGAASLGFAERGIAVGFDHKLFRYTQEVIVKPLSYKEVKERFIKDFADQYVSEAFKDVSQVSPAVNGFNRKFEKATGITPPAIPPAKLSEVSEVGPLRALGWKK